MALSGSLWLSLALFGSLALWLALSGSHCLALIGSLWLSPAVSTTAAQQWFVVAWGYAVPFEKFLIFEYTQGQREDRRVNFWIDFKHIHTEKYERGVKD